jgi:ATP-dependent exoDNAse (exonuclease V) alpha subunit
LPRAYAGWVVPDVRKSLLEIRKKAHGKRVWRRLTACDVLVIDEISMCESNFFERLNALLKEARESSKPFGGLQLVVTGDVSWSFPNYKDVTTNPMTVLSTISSETFPELR